VSLKAQLKWTEGRQFVAQAGGGPAVVIDTRDSASGPSPMEMVLMGVAGCTAFDVLMIMEKKRAQITDFQVNISGQRAEDYPRRFTDIHIEYILYGRGIKPKGVEQAIELSENKYCSATASLSATIHHSYRIIEVEEKS
jgi:putative redox protein